jgi:hypothetical protein
MMEIIPVCRDNGRCRGGYSRRVKTSGRAGGPNGKFACPKCGTVFYSRANRPHCPNDDYGNVVRAPVSAIVNYAEMVV